MISKRLPSKIYLARHATPDWTRFDLIYFLPPGPPLTLQGEQEAEALGAFFRENSVQKIFASPLERAARTAEIASNISGIPMEVVDDLAEWRPSEDENTIRQRLWPVFEAAAQAGEDGGAVALVTHGGPIGFLLTELGMTKEDLRAACVYDHRNPLPPAGAWEVSPNGSEQSWTWRLAFIPEAQTVEK